MDTEKDKTTEPDSGAQLLEDFNEKLQELVIDQASRLINLSLYNKAVLSALPVALLATDKDGRIRTVNNAAEEILDTRADNLYGKLLMDFLGSLPEIPPKADQAITSGKSFQLTSRTLTLQSGKTIVGNLFFQPLKDEENVICGLLLTIEDLTYIHYLQDAFKRYVPESVSETIAGNPERLKLGGEEKELTVLFSDLIGFTAIAEMSSPTEMVTILSDYFDEMTEQVFAQEGTLCEYVGDELLAIFGAPVEQPDNAKRACRSALAMNNRLAQLRKIWKKSGRPALKARIGVNTGTMLVGNLGSRHRFSYGVIGDNVNLGSRLEGLCGIYGVDILISEDTARCIGKEFILREVDQVAVKGRGQLITIYELIAETKDSFPPHKEKSVQLYAEALELYRARQWAGATKCFTAILSLCPDDGPSRIMLERCDMYRDSPPPEDWDGAFRHEKKK